MSQEKILKDGKGYQVICLTLLLTLINFLFCLVFFMGDTSENEPKLYSEAKGISEWEHAMLEEISALKK